MNKSLCVAGLGMACSLAVAQSSVTLAGTVDVGVRHVKNGSVGSLTSEVSGSNSTSKLIVRGQEDLGGNLRAGFYLDSTILADMGGAGASAPAGQFWDRQSTVNLTHTRFGELRLGRDWSPVHLVWSNFDPFAALGIAGANTFRSLTASRVLGQAFGTTPEAQNATPMLRVSNAIEYFLPPDLWGFYGHIVKSWDEGGTTTNGFTKGDGFRLGWAKGAVNIAAGQFMTRNAANSQRFKDQVYGLSYDFGFVKLDVAQRRWEYGSDSMINTHVGAVIPAGPGVVKLSYLWGNQKGATAALDENDATQLGVGYVYAFSKRTALYAHASYVDNDGSAVFTIPGGPAVSANPAAPNFFGGQSSKGFEAGIRHNF